MSMLSLRRYFAEHVAPIRAAVQARFPREPVEVQEVLVTAAASPLQFARGPIPPAWLEAYLSDHAAIVVRTARAALGARMDDVDANVAWQRALEGVDDPAPRALDAVVLATQVRLAVKPYHYWSRVQADASDFGAPKHEAALAAEAEGALGSQR